MPCTLVDGELLPDWLANADTPWLRELLLQAAAFAGRPFADLAAAWRQHDVPPRAGVRWTAVLATLRDLVLPRRAMVGEGRVHELRRVVFAAVARGATRAEALAAGAAASGIAADAVAARLFADLGAQRAVRWPPGLDPDRLRRATNGRFAQALLTTATAAELELHGQSRTVLRTAWLHGASFRFVGGDADGARLAWLPAPGDARAGRRLAGLLPVLGLARRFVLRAACRWRGRRGTLVLSSLDALPVGEPSAPFDSRLEAAVAARLCTELSGFELVREPAPLPLGDGLAFPDFALRPRAGASHAAANADTGASWWGEARYCERLAEPSWWIELAGLRDPRALAGKVALLEREVRYLLCVPRARCPEALAGHARVVPFGRGPRGIAELVAGVRRVVVA
ncbi:MAG: DUF790 family protein [Planctomycetes bacterium]|nr:DUF790 family protein [Planctomycetota bacterium]